MPSTPFKRVLLKVSGESLKGSKTHGVDPDSLDFMAGEIKSITSMGVELAIVVGGGNIWRGSQAEIEGMERATADYAGMLATVISALALQDSLERKHGLNTRTLSAINIQQMAEPYIRRRAIRHLERNRIVIFAAGTGNPFFSTDTAATLRASELDCKLIIKATKVNGIYDKDPLKHKTAKLIKKISYNEVINKNLKVMDLTAISLAKDTKIPIFITNIFKKNSLINTLNRKGSYSKIS